MALSVLKRQNQARLTNWEGQNGTKFQFWITSLLR